MSCVFSALSNLIPFIVVPLMYLMTYRTADVCAGDGFPMYFANMFVIVARSGRVACDSHSSDPTRLRILLMRGFLCAGDIVLCLIESTGCPDL